MAEDGGHYRRVNILIREDQHEQVVGEGLNMSGLVRGLLDDHFNHAKVVLSLSPEARRIYEMIISNFGVSDAVLEPYVLKALDAFLEDRIKTIESLRNSIKGSDS
ncbi:MAG: hypothetical protein AAGE01_25310 [Pseudomonadota bacterium]